MRLIDADKYLEKVCTYKETGCGSCKLQTACPKDAPTVKEIPTKWLLNSRSRYFEADYPMSVCVVDEVLNLWEKVSLWCIVIGLILGFLSFVL